ncbi:Tryptophan--tRNA ligase, mitochondrial [Tieghemiomyces parasiticus]|uniref:tryptophan--tRNA ligase n=1 Tax=Tieghemiomyces parasiticus TaxID=78921 RepID=A0A9W8A7A5_9FUNG|nr:Tryptophan--tRNA ligase, mitochondrial [Tieghemiomyces parasiticus]
MRAALALPTRPHLVQRRGVACFSSARSLRRDTSASSITTTTLVTDTGAPQRVLSGIQPTGSPHLGNYLGSISNWVRLQQSVNPSTAAVDRCRLVFSIADLHAVTIPQDPVALRQDIRHMAAVILASGLQPDRCVLFRQSQIYEHAMLSWLFQCLTPMGWLNRMTQWKSKLQQKRGEAAQVENFDIGKSGLCLGLFAYPTLQAADILLYKGEIVPVGEDQIQHIELARDTALLANKTVKQDVFPLPRALLTPTKRIMSLRDPTRKMSKSDPSVMARISVDDDPDTIRLKIRKATTDSISVPSFDPVGRPGVSSLLEIYSALDGRTIDQLCTAYQTANTQQFKQDLADVVVEKLAPIRHELVRIEKDPAYLDAVLDDGAVQAREIASANYREFARLMGL